MLLHQASWSIQDQAHVLHKSTMTQCSTWSSAENITLICSTAGTSQRQSMLTAILSSAVQWNLLNPQDAITLLVAWQWLQKILQNSHTLKSHPRHHQSLQDISAYIEIILSLQNTTYPHGIRIKVAHSMSIQAQAKHPSTQTLKAVTSKK